MKGFQGPNTTVLMVFGLENPIIWVVGPLGEGSSIKYPKPSTGFLIACDS